MHAGLLQLPQVFAKAFEILVVGTDIDRHMDPGTMFACEGAGLTDVVHGEIGSSRAQGKTAAADIHGIRSVTDRCQAAPEIACRRQQFRFSDVVTEWS